MSRAVKRIMIQFSISMKHSKELMDSLRSLVVRALTVITKKKWTIIKERANTSRALSCDSKAMTRARME